MKRSRLEMYIDILEVLAKGELKITHIMRKTNLNGSLLKDMLDFLIEKNLVKEITLKEKTVFVVTKRGIVILRAFKQVQQVFPDANDGQMHTPLFR
jgi:predicted transcriptional regulator